MRGDEFLGTNCNNQLLDGQQTTEKETSRVVYSTDKVVWPPSGEHSGEMSQISLKVSTKFTVCFLLVDLKIESKSLSESM
jgi:hypothetical protein